MKKSNVAHHVLRTTNHVIIGITGPICSGKTTAADYLRQKGYSVINVDRFVHALYMNGTPLYYSLKKKYGSRIIAKDGEIDRKELGKIAFTNEVKYKEFTSIVYPVMNSALRNAVKMADSKTVVLDMAVLFESGFYKEADGIIYVQPSTQVWKKAMFKRGKPVRFLEISKYQSLFSPVKKIALSDCVIYNDTTVKILQKIAEKSVRELLEALGESGRKRRANKKDT